MRICSRIFQGSNSFIFFSLKALPHFFYLTKSQWDPLYMIEPNKQELRICCMDFRSNQLGALFIFFLIFFSLNTILSWTHMNSKIMCIQFFFSFQITFRLGPPIWYTGLEAPNFILYKLMRNSGGGRNNLLSSKECMED